MKLLKITILKNYGDKQTYLNQVQLGYVKEGATAQSRDKTFSEYVKLTSTERELKRALEQISRLTVQQDKLKATVSRQMDIIASLEDVVKKVTNKMQKLHETQEIQAMKINMLQGGKIVKNNHGKVYQ